MTVPDAVNPVTTWPAGQVCGVIVKVPQIAEPSALIPLTIPVAPQSPPRMFEQIGAPAAEIPVTIWPGKQVMVDVGD